MQVELFLTLLFWLKRPRCSHVSIGFPKGQHLLKIQMCLSFALVYNMLKDYSPHDHIMGKHLSLTVCETGKNGTMHVFYAASLL